MVPSLAFLMSRTFSVGIHAYHTALTTWILRCLCRDNISKLELVSVRPNRLLLETVDSLKGYHPSFMLYHHGQWKMTFKITSDLSLPSAQRTPPPSHIRHFSTQKQYIYLTPRQAQISSIALTHLDMPYNIDDSLCDDFSPAISRSKKDRKRYIASLSSEDVKLSTLREMGFRGELGVVCSLFKGRVPVDGRCPVWDTNPVIRFASGDTFEGYHGDFVKALEGIGTKIQHSDKRVSRSAMTEWYLARS